MQNTHAPSSPTPNEWVCPSGSREPKENDQEVTFPGEGRWGPLRQPTPSTEPEWLAGGRVPSGAPHEHHALLHLGQIWGNWLPPWHQVCTWAPQKSILLVQCYPWQNRGMVWTMEPWGSMHKGPLPRVSGSRKHNEVSQRGSGRYGLVYGPCCWCFWHPGQTVSYFGTVAPFDVLMQNFYKITQGNNEKVPLFAMRLEGTLNQIRLRCPRWITDCEVPWHLKEWLFHGVWKHVRDSIRYVYGNSKTTYSELVVTAHWAESKTEETKERVKARSAVATEVASGSKELGDQTARLMATLTRVEQGSCPASAPNSPSHRGHGRGQADRNTPVCPSFHNGQTGLDQTASIHSSSATNRESTESLWREIYRHRMVHRVVLRAQRTPTPCNVSDARVGATWQGSVQLQPNIKPGWGDPGECGQTPLQQQSVSSQHSLSGPKPKLTQVKAVNKK